MLPDSLDSKRTARLRPGLRFLMAAWLLACSAACASHDPRFGPIPGGDHAARPASAPASGPYLIQPGDELEIRFFHTPEQNLTLPVRPDGFISVPLVHELRVAGRSAEEVRRDLVERCSHELANPEIAVIVRTFAQYSVHVGGEVDSPGVFQLTGTKTVLQAVFEAGGFLPSASPEDVIVVRRQEEGGYELVAADLAGVLSGRNAQGNFPLQAFDVVYVPKSRIGDVNKWVDQYIRQNIPISFSYRLDAP